MKRPPPAPKKSLEVKKKITKEPVEAEREAPTRRPADPREKRTGKMDEFVQTDLPKGVADSGQVAPVSTALYSHLLLLIIDNSVEQGFSTSGSRPHLGSPSDFRGVARLSTNLLKNDGIFKY